MQKIVTTLKLQLSLWEQGVLVRKRTDNLEAYDYYLRGVGYSQRQTKETYAQARQMLEKAIALDPQYAEAYALLSAIYYFSWWFQWSPVPQTLEQASELAQEAVRLDDSLPAAHYVLGWVHLWKKQHEQALAEAERTITLDPNYAIGYFLMGEVLMFAGRPEEAVGFFEKVQRLNPRAPGLYEHGLGFAYVALKRYDEAIPLLKRLITRHPNHWAAHVNLTVAYSESGREAEARAEVAEILRLSPNFSVEFLREKAPQRDPVLLGRWITALRKAGLK